ncbi:MAG: carbohydrate-binding protein [Kofleriaceae bacterium]
MTREVVSVAIFGMLAIGCHGSAGTALVDGGELETGGDASNEFELDAGTMTAMCPDNDVFGIRRIYCTKPGGDEWFINMDDPEENLDRFDPKTEITQNSDGSWKVTSSKVRMNVFTPEGYQQDLITTYDQDDLAAKGYMQSPADWKNVEMTGYVKVNDADDGGFAWYGRGGFHGGSAGDGGSGCEGTSYKGALEWDGQTRIAKEQWHPHGYSFTNRKAAKGVVEDRWIGYKTIIYNVDNDTAVRVELWADWNADNTWEKIDEMLDDEGMGDEGGTCGGKSDQPMVWAGPVVTYRWDGATDVDVRDLSVREITPPTQP